MAKLTTAGKLLITVAILATAGAAAWHLGVREMLSGAEKPAGPKPSPGEAKPETPRPPTPTKGKGGAVGTADNPLKVSIVSFHGYAPALVANGRSLVTKPGSLYAKKNVSVEFVIQDDIPTLTTIFTANTAHCAWRTSDFWAQEQPNLRASGLDGRAIVIVDNTQGGDAVIAKDPAIQRIEDLADRRVALLQYTPSHGMLIDALENSSLTARKKQSVKTVFINAEEGTAGVRAAFEAGQVDAAVLWDPDLSLAVKKVPGAHVVYSTKTASNLIYDLIVCDKRVLDDPANQPALSAFVAGWLEGVEVAEKNHDEALAALVETEEFFKLLEKEHGGAFVKGLFANLVWTGLDDNARVLGLTGGTSHYDRVYRRFDQIYRAAGALANPNSPVINPADSFDDRYVKALLAQNPAATEEAKKPEFTFSETQRKELEAKPAALTKPVTVGFQTGSFELTKRAQKTIDEEMVPLIENNGSAYFIVSGNTDSTGARATNLKLSEQRAKSVVDYLVTQWEFKPERFKVVGNGPDQPLCTESRPEEGMSLEECRAMNRTTRVAVLAR